VSFPSFLPATRYTRPRLPSDGSLGSHFPILFGTVLGYDYHLFLSMPSFRSVIDTLLVPFVRVLSSSSLTLRNSCANARPTWSVPVRLFRGSYKETFGSPKFPGYPLELMPCSSTPVVTSALAISHSGLLPSTSMTASAFPPIFRRLSLVIFFHLSTIIQISGLNYTACFLAYLGFRLPLPDLPARFTTALLARL